MIKLKEIVSPSGEYNDRDVEDFETKNEILAYLTEHGKEPQVIQLGKEEYIIWDDKIVDPEFPLVKEKREWIWDHDARRIREALQDLIEERFNKAFWMYPEMLYHGTPEENVESIKQFGIKMQHKSRGLSNRHIHSAVFTEKSPEFCGYHYGPAVFEINTPQMKADGFMPFVTKEPNHIESDVVNFLAHKIGAWTPDKDRDFAQSQSEGTTEDTIIVSDNIPAKYVKLI